MTLGTVSIVRPCFAQEPAAPAPQKSEKNPAPSQPETAPSKLIELAERRETLHVGDLDVPVRILGDCRSPFRYVTLHGIEETAPRAVAQHLQHHEGCLIELINPDERLVKFHFRNASYQFDPNRVFTVTGLDKNLLLLNPRLRRLSPRRRLLVVEAVQRFAEDLLRLMLEPPAPGQTLIAVHNNGTKPEAKFSFETFLDRDGYFPGVEALVYRRTNSPFDLLVVTDPADFEELSHRNLNVVLENGRRAEDDGSLSVFCGKKGIRYANVEARLGELEVQAEMLDTLREVLDKSAGTQADPKPLRPDNP